VRDLEDFLITECFYSGIIKGSLDQKAGCLYVNTFTSRDVQPSQLKDVIASLQNW
jgi:COP9 signalosome complex subunit 7